CVNVLERDVTLEQSVFTNTKTCVKADLKKCCHFIRQYAKEERNEILYESDDNQETSSTSSTKSIQHTKSH
ncbi:3911_t:CDS:1, partial [Dentiscutata erythropus]